MLLPALEQRVELRTDLRPLHLREIPRCDRLGRLGDRRALGDRRLDLGAMRLGLLLHLLGDDAAERIDSRGERSEVSHGVRGRDRRGEVLRGLRDVGGGGAGTGTLLEEGHLPIELGELSACSTRAPPPG